MKTITLLLLILNAFSVASKAQCKVEVSNLTTSVNGTGILPGDTICLEAGNRDYLYFSQIKGSEANPIVIVNKGGTVTIDTDHFFGIKFSQSGHLKLIGVPTDQSQYGIQITRVGGGAGITIDEMSQGIEIAYTEVSHTKIGGIYAKTDPDCSFVATREKFLFDGLKIHHCYLHDIADEGFYIGSSKYTGQHLPDCDTTVFPHLIHNVHIHDNLVERTGWDGIQVSSSPINCFIYNNIIVNDSEKETPNQMSGILIGGGSDCDCYNNKIFDGKGDGIDVFGFGEMKIYNNLIVRAGKSFQPDINTAYRHGIFIGNAPDNAAVRLKIMHNTIISPKSTGVKIFNTSTSNHLFFNNLITNPGSFNLDGEAAYLNLSGNQLNISVKNNLFSEHPENIGFVSFDADNFDLKPGSRAVNAGFEAGLNKVIFDIENRPRPHNNGFDIGAFECQDVFAGLDEPGIDPELTVFPNPASASVFVALKNVNPQPTDIILTKLNGKLVKVFNFSSLSSKFHLDLQGIADGFYLIHVITAEKTYHRKLHIIQP